MLDTKLNQAFDAKRDELVASFTKEAPGSYQEILERCLRAVRDNLGSEYDCPDPDRITRIDHGSWQGTLVFVIGEGGYQPDDYYVTKVGYGSCSHCDAFEAIESNYHEYDDEGDSIVTEAAAKQYLTLGLHMLQRMVKV